MPSLHHILAEAIPEEQKAQRKYLVLAERAVDASAKVLLEGLADEEAKHQALLQGLTADEHLATKVPKVQDLRISDFLADRDIGPSATFQEVLVHAAKQEGAAFRTYQAQSLKAEDTDVRDLFERLAAQEKTHKARLETLYDDVILRED